MLGSACSKEQPLVLERDPFVVVYRTSGCGQVSALAGENTSKDLLWWEDASKKYRFPKLRSGTAVDIRPGAPLIRYKLGRPGALQVPPAEIYTRRYLLAKGINSLALQEAFPQVSQETRETVAGSLALEMLGRDRLRVFAPPKEVSLQVAREWPEALLRCPPGCSLKDLQKVLNQQ